MNRGFFSVQPKFAPIVLKTNDPNNLTIEIRWGGTRNVLDTITVPLKRSALQEVDLMPMFREHTALTKLPEHEKTSLMARIITIHNKLMVQELARSRYL